MKAIVIKSLNGTLEIDTIPIPIIKKDELLIKNEFSQIIPADINFVAFSYKEYLKTNKICIPGFEGVGTVVKVGDESYKSFLYKRVVYAARGTGTWAEYCKANFEQVICIDEIEIKENGIPSFANPLTVMCILDLTRLAEQKCVVQTGASSSCGKMFIKVCKLNGIKTINVVRRQESSLLSILELIMFWSNLIKISSNNLNI